MSKKWKPNKRESLWSGDTCFSRTIFIFGNLWGNILLNFWLGFQLLMSFSFTTTHCHQFGGRTLLRHSHVNLLVDTTLQCHIIFHYYSGTWNQSVASSCLINMQMYLLFEVKDTRGLDITWYFFVDTVYLTDTIEFWTIHRNNIRLIIHLNDYNV